MAICAFQTIPDAFLEQANRFLLFWKLGHEIRSTPPWRIDNFGTWESVFSTKTTRRNPKFPTPIEKESSYFDLGSCDLSSHTPNRPMHFYVCSISESPKKVHVEIHTAMLCLLVDQLRPSFGSSLRALLHPQLLLVLFSEALGALLVFAHAAPTRL